MTKREVATFEFSSRYRQDLALVLLETVLCFILALRFQWSERLYAWTRRWEAVQADEFAFVLFAFVVGLTWFSVRRWREARDELDRRLALEAAIAQSHAESGRILQLSIDLKSGERFTAEVRKEMTQSLEEIRWQALAIRQSAKGVFPAAETAQSDKALSIVARAEQLIERLTRLTDSEIASRAAPHA